jgi:hypothetical protein
MEFVFISDCYSIDLDKKVKFLRRGLFMQRKRISGLKKVVLELRKENKRLNALLLRHECFDF